MNDQLRKLLTESGLSLSAIARAADVPFTTVQSFMQSDNDVRLGTATKLAKAIGYEVKYIKLKSSKAGA